MKVLRLNDAEESALAYLMQACLSDRLLERSGLRSDLAATMLEAVQTLDAKLMEIAVRSGDRQERQCGEFVADLPGVGPTYCTRPLGHARSSNGKPGHSWEITIRPS